MEDLPFFKLNSVLDLAARENYEISQSLLFMVKIEQNWSTVVDGFMKLSVFPDEYLPGIMIIVIRKKIKKTRRLGNSIHLSHPNDKLLNSRSIGYTADLQPRVSNTIKLLQIAKR